MLTFGWDFGISLYTTDTCFVYAIIEIASNPRSKSIIHFHLSSIFVSSTKLTIIELRTLKMTIYCFQKYSNFQVQASLLLEQYVNEKDFLEIPQDMDVVYNMHGANWTNHACAYRAFFVGAHFARTAWHWHILSFEFFFNVLLAITIKALPYHRTRKYSLFLLEYINDNCRNVELKDGLVAHYLKN